MAQRWYVKQKGKAFGPIATARLKKLALEGKITPTNELRLGEDGSWVVASKVKGLFSDRTPADPPKKKSTNRVHNERQASVLAGAAATESLKRARTNPYHAPNQVQAEDPSVARATTPHTVRGALKDLWFKPRETMQRLIAERSPNEAFLVISAMFSLKYIDNVITSESPFAGLLFSPLFIPLSAVVGIICLVLMAFLHRIIGHALGGNGDVASLRTAFAWSFAPVIVSIPLSLIVVILWSIAPATVSIPLWMINGPFWILTVWSIAMEIAGISAAHQFGLIRATLTFLLSIVLIALVAGVLLTLSFMIATS